ncbi:unnamed protein product, partial [Polarella glacialis]
ELFRVSWVQHLPDEEEESGLDFNARMSRHLRAALSHALNERFPKARSLLVVEEDMEAAPDMLWFFAQLEPLLHKDENLWCISAWNENGVATYAADLTALVRTDVFAGSLAWLLPAELYRKELLPSWPKGNWAQHLRGRAVSAGRQCIVPEISRARHVGRETGEDSAHAPSKAAGRDAAIFFAADGPSIVDLAQGLLGVAGIWREVYREKLLAGLHASVPLQDLSQLPLLSPEVTTGRQELQAPPEFR